MSRLFSVKAVRLLLHLSLKVQAHVARTVRVGLDADEVEGADLAEGELVGLAGGGRRIDLSHPWSEKEEDEKGKRRVSAEQAGES